MGLLLGQEQLTKGSLYSPKALVGSQRSLGFLPSPFFLPVESGLESDLK